MTRDQAPIPAVGVSALPFMIASLVTASLYTADAATLIAALVSLHLADRYARAPGADLDGYRDR